MAYCRNAGESTQDWLERLLVMNAPQDIRGNVQAILEKENRLAVAQGNIPFQNSFIVFYIFDNHFIFITPAGNLFAWNTFAFGIYSVHSSTHSSFTFFCQSYSVTLILSPSLTRSSFSPPTTLSLSYSSNSNSHTAVTFLYYVSFTHSFAHSVNLNLLTLHCSCSVSLILSYYTKSHPLL